jgi:hypothetical protein
MAKARKRKPKKKPGPKIQRLKLNTDWISAIKRSLAEKKPDSGWPEPVTKQAKNVHRSVL